MDIMVEIFKMSLAQVSGIRRLLVIALLCGLLVLVAVIANAFGDVSPDSFYDDMFITTVMPLLALTVTASTFAMEIEDRTLSNLVLAPVSRWQIVVPKLLAGFTMGVVPFMLTGIVVTAFLFSSDVLAYSAAMIVSATIGFLAYACLFTLIGSMSTRAIVIGLVYVMMWEGALSIFVSGIKYLSIRQFTLSLLNGIESGIGINQAFSLPSALYSAIALLLVIGVSVSLTVWRLRRMEIA